MKHRSISIISIVGAVIAGLISVGNLVQLMVIKAQELKERGTDNFLSDLLMYPLDADFRETTLYTIAFGVLGAAFIFNTISFFINADGKGLKIGMLAVRTVQIVCAVIVTIVKYKTQAVFPALNVMIPGIVIACAEIAAIILYKIEEEHHKSVLFLAASTMLVLLMNVVYLVLMIVGAVILLSIFLKILELFMPVDVPKIPVFSAAGKFVGYVSQDSIQ